MESNNSVPRRSHLAAVHCLCYLKHKPKSIKELCATVRVSRDERQDASEQEERVDGVG